MDLYQGMISGQELKQKLLIEYSWNAKYLQTHGFILKEQY